MTKINSPLQSIDDFKFGRRVDSKEAAKQAFAERCMAANRISKTVAELNFCR